MRLCNESSADLNAPATSQVRFLADIADNSATGQ
jgi:hypothetical protein